FDLSDSLSTDSSLRALKMAARGRMYKEPLIHHSDRGLQYCSDAYQKQLKKSKIKVSMTEKYDPYANAIAERVNGILKQEFLLEDYRCSIDVLKKIVSESVNTYNYRRPHTSCYMLTPEQMHQQRELVKPTYRKKAKSASGLQPTC
ncbi:MAG: integrase core domain-containing protein, partial [Rikenellaceae bacterium]